MPVERDEISDYLDEDRTPQGFTLICAANYGPDGDSSLRYAFDRRVELWRNGEIENCSRWSSSPRVTLNDLIDECLTVDICEV